MKTKVKALIDNIEPLLSIQLKYAERFDNDTIQITTARAREAIKQLRELQKEINSDKKDPSFFKMMDQKFAHAL